MLWKHKLLNIWCDSSSWSLPRHDNNQCFIICRLGFVTFCRSTTPGQAWQISGFTLRKTLFLIGKSNTPQGKSHKGILCILQLLLRRSILGIFVLSQFILALGQKVPFEYSLDGMQGVVFVVPSVYSSNSQLITVTWQFPISNFIQNITHDAKGCVIGDWYS